MKESVFLSFFLRISLTWRSSMSATAQVGGLGVRFKEAIHLGMTATPKQDENIDTYEYFCQEEPEVFIDPDHPEEGKRRTAAYEYSLGRGIEDGFLATYKVHHVRTTVDKDGLPLENAIEQGAEVFIPEDVEPKQYYTPLNSSGKLPFRTAQKPW